MEGSCPGLPSGRFSQEPGGRFLAIGGVVASSGFLPKVIIRFPFWLDRRVAGEVDRRSSLIQCRHPTDLSGALDDGVRA